MEDIKPITPEEALKDRINTIHPDIIKIINSFIKERYSSEKIIVKIEVPEIIEKFLEINPSSDKQEIINKHWLDFESVYEAVGWKVKYDKPGFNETNFPSFFEFSKKF